MLISLSVARIHRMLRNVPARATRSVALAFGVGARLEGAADRARRKAGRSRVIENTKQSHVDVESWFWFPGKQFILLMLG
jgi:hypothetical protein